MGAGASSAPKGAATKYAAPTSSVQAKADENAAATGTAATSPTAADLIDPGSKSTRVLGSRGVASQGSYRNKPPRKATDVSASPQASPVHAPVVVAATSSLASASNAAAAIKEKDLIDWQRTMPSANGTLLASRGVPLSGSASESPFCKTLPHHATPGFDDATLSRTWPPQYASTRTDASPPGVASIGSKQQGISTVIPPGMPMLRQTSEPNESLKRSSELGENRSVVAKMAAEYWKKENREPHETTLPKTTGLSTCPSCTPVAAGCVSAPAA